MLDGFWSEHHLQVVDKERVKEDFESNSLQDNSEILEVRSEGIQKLDLQEGREHLVTVNELLGVHKEVLTESQVN